MTQIIFFKASSSNLEEADSEEAFSMTMMTFSEWEEVGVKIKIKMYSKILLMRLDKVLEALSGKDYKDLGVLLEMMHLGDLASRFNSSKAVLEGAWGNPSSNLLK